MSWKMPAEWVKHERTWLSFPSSEYGIPAEEAYRAWSNVANAASEYEPVTVLVDPAQDEISKKYLSSEITKLVCDLDEVKQILKTVGFVNGAPGFTNQASVVNGASELFINVFGEAGRAARSSVGVAELPLNSPVEVEVVVSLK